MGPAGADRLKEPVTDLLIDGSAGRKHQGGAVGVGDVHQLEGLDGGLNKQQWGRLAPTPCLSDQKSDIRS